MFAYPASLDMSDLAEIIAGLGSTPANPNDLIRAMWSVEGYALSMAHPLTPSIKHSAPLSKTSLATKLRSLQAGQKTGWSDVDWCEVYWTLAKWGSELLGICSPGQTP